MPGLNALSGEVRVTPSEFGNQVGSFVIALTGGNYMILWYNVVGLEEPDYILNGRVFAPDGSQMRDFTLGNTEDAAAGTSAGAVALADGGFAVIYSPDLSNQYHIQRFDPSGTAIGGPIVPPFAAPQDTPTLAARSDGGFYAVYDALKFDTYSLVGQRYGADGTAIGAPFDIAIDYAQPSSTVLANDDLLVVWEDTDQSQPGTNIHARIFSPAGTPRGPVILVDAEAVLARSNATAAAFDDGRFVVTWTNATSDQVLVRLFAANGAPLGAPVEVDPEFVGEERSGEVIETEDGGFLVTYVALGKDGDGAGLFARRFGADGQPAGPSWQIPQTSAGPQISGGDNVAMLADGTLVFSWSGNGQQPGNEDEQGIFARRFSLDAVSNMPTAGNDVLPGTGADDRFFLQQGGDDQVSGGDGSDGFFFGAAFTPADSVDGGSGIDTLALQGNYAGLTLGSVSNVELLALFSGSETRFGDGAGNLYDYDIDSADANVASGALLKVIATGLLPGEDLNFDGSAESDGMIHIYAGRGQDNLTGGAQGDGFFFGAEGNLTGADRIHGGAGTDSIALRGNYVGDRQVIFAEASLTDVEVLTFLSGHGNEYGGVIAAAGFDYAVTMANGNVAAGKMLNVIGATLGADESVSFDGHAEVDGSYRIIMGAGDDIVLGSQSADVIVGGAGADRLDGSGGADVYAYRSTAESTAMAADRIVLGEGDRIDLSFIDANGNAGDGNQAFGFIGAQAFTQAAGQLRAYQASGGWIVEADVDGNGVADMVIEVTTVLTITADTFVP